ncbi:hypothetical protein Tco_0427884 [Tanacetum coccineum]
MAARMASVVDGVGDGGGMMRRWCGCGDEVRGGCDDGDDDESGGRMEGERRVEASCSGDRLDRVTRITFGFGRKSPPEKFSGGGATVVAGSGGGGGWPDSLREKREL